MARALLAAAAVSGFLAVALGAFGAHGLERHLAGAPDLARRMEWWRTAAAYHLAHSLAVAIAALVAGRAGTAGVVGALAFLAGIVLFSGSLYAMTLTGARGLGAVTPVGGVAFLVGWAALLVAALRMR
ncbi:MAG: DUF423 domain-containing protein [Deltaproteobacteria bacterium]|nr:DUF423 domain-containing protein [Deltaproteobacteria bacterium]